MPDEPRLRRSSLLAGVAEGVVATALPLLATNITRDPLAVAGVVVAQHLPWIGVALGWHLVSRRDRRTMIGLIDSVRALAVGYLGLLALAGADTILKIQVVAFIVGLGEALTGTIEEETGDSRLSMRGMLGLAVIGMPLGGLLYAVFLAVPFMIDVLFFALAALFALFIPGPVRAARSLGDSSPARLAEGTLPVTITALVASVARSAVLGVLVLFALDNLGLGAPAFGFLLAGLAAATAAGGWVAPEAGTALGLRRGFAVASVVSGVALVIAATVADPARPWAAALALGIAGASATTGMVLLRALLPVAAGRPVTGSALRAFHLVEWGGLCGGALAGGWLARGHGVDVVLLWAAGAWAMAAVSVAAVRRSEPAMTISIDSANWLDAA